MTDQTLGGLKERPVVTGRPNLDLNAVERLFKEHGIRHLPIVDAEHRPIGMVSANDLARLTNWRAYFQPEDHKDSRERLLEMLLAEDIMHTPVYTLPAFAGADAVANLFEERRIHCAVLIDENGALTGIITAHDLLRLAYPPQHGVGTEPAALL